MARIFNALTIRRQQNELPDDLTVNSLNRKADVFDAITNSSRSEVIAIHNAAQAKAVKDTARELLDVCIDEERIKLNERRVAITEFQVSLAERKQWVTKRLKDIEKEVAKDEFAEKFNVSTEDLEIILRQLYTRVKQS